MGLVHCGICDLNLSYGWLSARLQYLHCKHTAGFELKPSSLPKYTLFSKGTNICLMKSLIIMFPICPIWFQDFILEMLSSNPDSKDTVFSHARPWIPGDEKSIFTVVIVRRAGLLWSQEDFEWRWSVPLFKCLTVLEFSFILFDLCLLITFFNFIMNYVPIVTFWIFTYHKIWILSIMFCSIWSYWIIYFLACLEVSWRVVS